MCVQIDVDNFEDSLHYIQAPGGVILPEICSPKSKFLRECLNLEGSIGMDMFSCRVGLPDLLFGVGLLNPFYHLGSWLGYL